MELNRIIVQSFWRSIVISLHWNMCLCLICSLRLMSSQLFCSKSCSWHLSSWVRCHQSNSNRWLNSRRCFQLVNRSNWASAAKLPVENLAHHIMASCQLLETESDPQIYLWSHYAACNLSALSASWCHQFCSEVSIWLSLFRSEIKERWWEKIVWRKGDTLSITVVSL